MVMPLVLFQSQLSVKSNQGHHCAFLRTASLRFRAKPCLWLLLLQQLPACPRSDLGCVSSGTDGGVAAWCLQEHAKPPYSHFRQTGWSMKGDRLESPRPLPGGEERAAGVKCAEAEIACCSQADIASVTTSTINTIVISSPPASPLLLLDRP